MKTGSSRFDLQTNAAHRCIEIGGGLGYGNVVQENRSQYAGFCFNVPHGIEEDGPGVTITRWNVFANNTYAGLVIYGQKVTDFDGKGWSNNVVYNNTVANFNLTAPLKES